MDIDKHQVDKKNIQRREGTPIKGCVNYFMLSFAADIFLRRHALPDPYLYFWAQFFIGGAAKLRGVNIQYASIYSHVFHGLLQLSNYLFNDVN